MNTRLKKGLWGLGAVLVVHVGLGNLLHRVVFPMPAPDPSTFPRTGDRFGSDLEGFEQHVQSVEDGWIGGELIVHPGAIGPPVHFHDGFDEVFAVTEGTLHLQVGDDVVQVQAGESYRVPAGTAHKPFNPGTERVVVSGEKFMPQSFSACLVQLYAFMEERGSFEPGLDLVMQMSVIDPICDTHIVEPPPAVQAVTNAFIAPIARVSGYRNYYPERALHPIDAPPN